MHKVVQGTSNQFSDVSLVKSVYGPTQATGCSNYCNSVACPKLQYSDLTHCPKEFPIVYA